MTHLLWHAYLLAAALAHDTSVFHASPEFVALLEEVWEVLPPATAQCPGEYLILVLLLILLHGVGKVTVM